MKRGDYGAQTTFEVKNTGDRDGSEVAQLYIRDVRPRVQKAEIELVGFAKIPLQPGESKTVTLNIDVSLHCSKAQADGHSTRRSHTMMYRESAGLQTRESTNSGWVLLPP